MADHWVQRTTAEYAAGWNNLLPTGPAWPRDPSTALQAVVSGLSQIWSDETETLAALLLSVESDPRSTNILLPEWERAFGLPDMCIPIPSANVSLRESNLVAKMTFIGAQSRAFFIAQAANTVGLTITIREFAPYMCGVSKCGDTSNLNSDLPGNLTAVTSAGTTTASPTLTFASVNSLIFGGMFVFDVTNSFFIGTVLSVNTVNNTVTLTANAAHAVTSGDTLRFSNRMRWQLGPREIRFYWVVKITGLLGNWAGADIHCLFLRWKPAHTQPIFDFSALQRLDESLIWDSGYIALL